MKKLLNKMTFYDKLLIIVVFVLSLLIIIRPLFFSFGDDREKEIVIQPQGEAVQRVPLSDTYQNEPLYFEVEGPLGTSIIEAYEGRVRLKEAPPDDPLKVCEKTGWIEREGPVIVCVPNQITVFIDSKDGDLDGVTY